MKKLDNDSLLPKIFGWCAIIIITLISSFWAFWGIIENFHEGWYSLSLIDNLMMLFGQYLLLTIIFTTFGVAGILSGKAASILSILMAVLFILYFKFSGTSIFFISIPLLIIAILFWFSHFPKKKIPLLIVIGIPLLTIIGFGIEPAIRVAGRIESTSLEQKLITINGQSLIFAPAGPGWQDNGTSWYEADSIAKHLNYDGSKVLPEIQNIWRLPALAELVKFSHRNGKPCNGLLDKNNHPHYSTIPDKEPPLWNTHSKIIYWWTADGSSDSTAYRFVYNGTFYDTPKKVRWGYLAFRAVKDTIIK
jgi:hypothetical protein